MSRKVLVSLPLRSCGRIRILPVCSITKKRREPSGASSSQNGRLNFTPGKADRSCKVGIGSAANARENTNIAIKLMNQVNRAGDALPTPRDRIKVFIKFNGTDGNHPRHGPRVRRYDAVLIHTLSRIWTTC